MSTNYTIDSSASLVLQPFIFRYDPSWVREGESFLAVPGTWCEVERLVKNTTATLALFCCPACAGTSVLRKAVHSIDGYGKITPSLICMHENDGHRCSFHRVAYLDKWNKTKPLYATAIERFSSSGKWIPEMHYCHAQNEKEARFHLGPGNYRIVAIGPAIGYFVEDEKRGILSAD